MSFVRAIGANGTGADGADGVGDTGGTRRDQHSYANQKPGLIACALIATGTSFNLRVVAVGIERPEELEFLKANECEEGQGFLLGKPVLPDVFAAHLSEESSRFVR
jgi:EAL domain-containing protein (putative c-di-GMP-specific phosphodiesterase class I)